MGSSPAYSTKNALVAQLEEQLICNQPVAGSIPVQGSKNNASIAQLIEHSLGRGEVPGLIPGRGSIYFFI